MPFGPLKYEQSHCYLSQIIDPQPLCSLNTHNISAYLRSYVENRLKPLNFSVYYEGKLLISCITKITDDFKINIIYQAFRDKENEYTIEHRFGASGREIVMGENFFFMKFFGDFMIAIDAINNNLELVTNDITSLYSALQLRLIDSNSSSNLGSSSNISRRVNRTVNRNKMAEATRNKLRVYIPKYKLSLS